MTVLEITAYGCNTLRRLRREARIVDPSIQPHLAPAYELDRWSPTLSVVTELLPDITLDDLVSISPLPAAAALHALQDVAETLDAMHECGLVHGDLRPSTVYILPDGRAALARPEAAPPGAGTIEEAAWRADAHDFAILAFELLTGVHPLEPDHTRSLVTQLPVLPRRAAKVLERAVTATPEQRPLPLELMCSLDAIPPEEWPSNRLRRRAEPPEPAKAEPADAEPVEAEPADAEPADAEPADAEPADAEPAAPDPITPEPVAPEPTAGEPVVVKPLRPQPPRVVVRVVPPRPRRSLLRRILGPFVILLGLATVFGGGAAGAWLLFAPGASRGDTVPATAPHVRKVSVSVTPPQALCPRAALHVAATIVTDGGEGEVVVRWRLPDGSTADTQTLSVDEGRTTLRAAIDLTLTGSDELVGDVLAVVGPGEVQASAPLRYLCPGGQQRPDRSSRA